MPVRWPAGSRKCVGQRAVESVLASGQCWLLTVWASGQLQESAVQIQVAER